MTGKPELSEENLRQARVVWDYHLMNHPRRPCDIAIGLGGCDPAVALYAAELYRQGLFPRIVFTGATSGATAHLFPEGEAFAFRDLAVESGVPEAAVLVEPRATNTGQNIQYSREVLDKAGIPVRTAILICMPYMERRAYAAWRRQWPELEVVCASQPITFEDYLASFDDPHLVIDYMVGDLQRVIEYPKLGFAIEQDAVEDVHTALKHLITAGFDSALLKP